MKKMALALLATIAVVLGLAVAPAQAAPYAGSVPTSTTITAVNPPNAGQRVVVRANVRASGARVTDGDVYLRCATVRNGRTIVRLGSTVAYNGGTQRIVGPVLNLARTWGCRLYYVGGSSVFANSSSDRVAVRVR
ncbi:hypothetical protein [Nocardioides sp.]|uniref:hypothetical protein n=1 Tax=Nocardioides sp. TaxID=35761 RepID=UPI0035119F50